MVKDEKTKPNNLVFSREHVEKYAIGAAGGWTKYDFRIRFYSEIIGTDKNEEGEYQSRTYVSNLSLILPPLPMKELAVWLIKHIKEFEKENGEIILEELNPKENFLESIKYFSSFDEKNILQEIELIKHENEKNKRKKEKTEEVGRKKKGNNK